MSREEADAMFDAMKYKRENAHQRQATCDALANKNITAVGKPASDYAQPMQTSIAVNQDGCHAAENEKRMVGVTPAQPSNEEDKQEAPLRIDVAINGLE